MGYFIAATIGATVTLIAIACFIVSKDHNEGGQAITRPVHSEPPQLIVRTFDVVNVWAETYLNDEELLHLASDRLKRQLADALWEHVSVSQCDDRRNCRKHYLANIKVVNNGQHNPLAAEDVYAKIC